MTNVEGLTEQDVEHMLAAAADSYASGDGALAERILRGVLAAEPREVRAIKLLGTVLMVQDRRTEAEQVFRAALAIDPKDPYVLLAAAEIALAALRLRDALPLLNRLFRLDPKH